jgi:hypothetical protein
MPLLYAGIDEAGYGPLLGPLCVGCAAFVVPDAAGDAAPASPGAPTPPPCLWKALSAAVCRTTTDRRRRIAVEDSKKLKGAKDAALHPLRHLERGVAAFASAVAGAPAEWPDDDALLAALGAHAAPPPEGDAWHDAPLPLPVGNDPAALRISGAMLRTALAKAGIKAASLSVRALDAREFNRLAARVGNKATSVGTPALRPCSVHEFTLLEGQEGGKEMELWRARRVERQNERISLQMLD